MSVFRVKLNNTEQGQMDLDPSTAGPDDQGDQFATSLQRSVYIMGPNRINRLLRDGEEFTDCNYWKRFAYPQVSFQDAFIEVVDDDGSIYSDIPEENTYPHAETVAVDGGNGVWATDQSIDFAGDMGSYTSFLQMTETSGNPVSVRLNGSATFTLAASTTQIFNANDLSVTLLEFAQNGGTPGAVDVLASVRSVCTS